MKNVHIFTTTFPSVSEIQTAIASSEYLFKECKEDDFSTFGFSGPNSVAKLANGYRISFTFEEKVMPSAAVKKQVDKKATEMALKFGRDLSKKEVAEVREIVVAELVKTAMTNLTTFYGYYHEATNRFIVDTTKRDLASKAIGIICHMLKSIETTTLHVSGVSNCLTTNILECIVNTRELGFDGFSYADKLHLKNADGETVQFKCDYTLEHVKDLIESGYQVNRVRLKRDGLSFDLTDDFKIKSIKTEYEFDDSVYSDDEIEAAEEEACLEILSGITTALVEFFKKGSEDTNSTPPPRNEAPTTSSNQANEELDLEAEQPNPFVNSEGKDVFYDESVEFVRETRRASVSSVQRKFRIGYNRAAGIIEQMEEDGIVSKPGHNGEREVLVPPKAA